MRKHEDEIRRIVAQLEDHLARVEASVAVLKALLAEDDDEGPGGETSAEPARM